ncbi:sorting nexin-32 isoform X2 [Rattus rattus]|uniref:sorting nexin-32 isoform X2 n=1 Tax=Rattus rattus TaxID=10117 RepID=UPI0013F33AFE|nr:sorting nexin-32 isoform X2 [Rattus rattus]
MSQLRRIMEENHQEAGKESKPSSMSVDLQGDSPLQVEISDAVSERDKVKFTVQTKPEFSVVRQHEEFIWLHDTYVENEEYAGLIIPPAPPRPDFEASREKLQKLGEGNSSITREEFAKMKQELEAEYLAIFKKTVAMHEVFLQRLAAHPTLRQDHNLSVFLEYSQDLSVREKNRKEVLGGFLKSIVRSADEVLITGISGLKEVDDFFEHERTFLVEYHTRIRDTCQRADRVMHSHKCLADNYIPLSAALSSLGTQAVNQLKRSFLKLAELFERLRKLEGRVASDEDLKLSDMLRYYMRDSQAAKDLLYRRLRALADYENANKALDKARTRNREVQPAESHQQLCCQRFERLSDSAKRGETRRLASPHSKQPPLPLLLSVSLQSSWTSSLAGSPLSGRISLSWQSWSSSMPGPAPCFSRTPLLPLKESLSEISCCSPMAAVLSLLPTPCKRAPFPPMVATIHTLTLPWANPGPKAVSWLCLTGQHGGHMGHSGGT